MGVAAGSRTSTRGASGAAAGSSLSVVTSVLVLAAALVGFVASEPPAETAPAVISEHPVAAETSPTQPRRDGASRHPERPKSAHRADGKQPVRERTRPVPDVYVEVYNNGGDSAAVTNAAGRLQALGWQVVGTDDWYGNIPASTVYWPAASYQPAARRLARALGIERTWPAVAPMRFDRLTVILTADFSG